MWAYHVPIVSNIFPVETGLKLNVHKTFIRRPGRHLNVLCTFTFRPVSTGLLTISFNMTIVKKQV